MYDRGLSVLEQYGLTVKTTYRGRGSLICDTQQGLVLIKEFQGSARKLMKQGELLDAVAASNTIKVDTLLKNQEEQYVSFDKDNIAYYVRNWYEGKECDTKSQEDVMKSVKTLASLHKVLVMPLEENYAKESLLEEYERHNKELRKIQRFIRKKQQKNHFEMRYLDSVEWFLAQGEAVVEQMRASDYERLKSQEFERGSICHGEFNQHNVLMLSGEMAVTNFDKWNYDIQAADLYQFIRKIMEKHNWDEKLGNKMLEAYNTEKPLSHMEFENLQMRFAYPEKYWKLANQYYTHRKSWISQKSLEKLEVLISQRDQWRGFLSYFGK